MFSIGVIIDDSIKKELDKIDEIRKEKFEELKKSGELFIRFDYTLKSNIIKSSSISSLQVSIEKYYKKYYNKYNIIRYNGLFDPINEVWETGVEKNYLILFNKTYSISSYSYKFILIEARPMGIVLVCFIMSYYFYEFINNIKQTDIEWYKSIVNFDKELNEKIKKFKTTLSKNKTFRLYETFNFTINATFQQLYLYFKFTPNIITDFTIKLSSNKFIFINKNHKNINIIITYINENEYKCEIMTKDYDISSYNHNLKDYDKDFLNFLTFVEITKQELENKNQKYIQKDYESKTAISFINKLQLYYNDLIDDFTINKNEIKELKVTNIKDKLTYLFKIKFDRGNIIYSLEIITADYGKMKQQTTLPIQIESFPNRLPLTRTEPETGIFKKPIIKKKIFNPVRLSNWHEYLKKMAKKDEEMKIDDIETPEIFNSSSLKQQIVNQDIFHPENYKTKLGLVNIIIEYLDSFSFFDPIHVRELTEEEKKEEEREGDGETDFKVKTFNTFKPIKYSELSEQKKKKLLEEEQKVKNYNLFLIKEINKLLYKLKILCIKSVELLELIKVIQTHIINITKTSINYDSKYLKRDLDNIKSKVLKLKQQIIDTPSSFGGKIIKKRLLKK